MVTPVSVGSRARPPDSKQSDGTLKLKNVRVHRLLSFCPSVFLALYLVPPFATNRVTGLLASACKSSELRLILLLRNSKLPCLYRSKGRQKICHLRRRHEPPCAPLTPNHQQLWSKTDSSIRSKRACESRSAWQSADLPWQRRHGGRNSCSSR